VYISPVDTYTFLFGPRRITFQEIYPSHSPIIGLIVQDEDASYVIHVYNTKLYLHLQEAHLHKVLCLILTIIKYESLLEQQVLSLKNNSDQNHKYMNVNSLMVISV